MNDECTCYSLLYETEGLGKCNINGKVPIVDTSTQEKKHTKKIVIIAVCAAAAFLLIRPIAANFIVSALYTMAKSDDITKEQEGLLDETVTDTKKESVPKGAVSLTSIEQPVEADGFHIIEEVLNTMGTTYDKAVVVNGVDSAYVRYNVGDFSRFTGAYSVDSSWALSDNEYSLLIYLDGNVDEPYADLKLNRSTVETPLDIDVSNAQFITFKLEGYHCSLVLSDCELNK